MPGYRLEPYNAFPRELDLWNLEGRRFIRSLPVLSPDRGRYAYSEILYMPNVRQTIASLYLAETPASTRPAAGRLPSEDALHPDIPGNPDPLDPNATIRERRKLASVGYGQVNPFSFLTLTVVDWSANGSRLLVKRRDGVLHVGLQTSDILVYDDKRGVVTIYPEIHRAIRHYWEGRNLPELGKISWDIQPLGWEPGSDAAVLVRAWAYDREEKKFLGLWRFDVDAERLELLSLDALAPAVVAANGWLAQPVPPPPTPGEMPRWKRPLRRQAPASAPPSGS